MKPNNTKLIELGYEFTGLSYARKANLIRPENIQIRLSCPICPNYEYVNGSKVETSLSPEQFIKHKKWHSQPHIKHESLEYFTYNLFKKIGKIEKYTSWFDWDTFLFIQINWVEYNWVYEMWCKSVRDTCYNSPCFDCWLRRINWALMHRHKKKGS